MLIGLRDKDGRLKVKDILDLNMDMKVEKVGNLYMVKVTRKYYLDTSFDNEVDAENALYNIANVRNEMEMQLNEK